MATKEDVDDYTYMYMVSSSDDVNREVAEGTTPRIVHDIELVMADLRSSPMSMNQLLERDT
jgi:hypothetical protein